MAEITSTQIIHAGELGYNATWSGTVDLTTGTGVLFFITTPAGGFGTWTPDITVGGQSFDFLGSTAAGTSNGTLFAYKLIDPPQGAAVPIVVSSPNRYFGPLKVGIIAMDAVQDFGFFDAGSAEISVALSGTTIHNGGLILTYGFGHYVTPNNPTSPNGAMTMVVSNNVDSGHSIKAATLPYAGPDEDIIINWTSPYNVINACAIEIEAGASGPATQNLTPSGIQNTSALGNHLAKDPNISVLGPQSIINTSALGSPTVTRQVVVFYDTNPPAHTVTGNPGTTVERTSVAANYRVSRASVPVVNGEKKYWEITIDNLVAESIIAVGVGAENTPLDAQLGGWQSNAISWDSSGGARQNNTGLNGKVVYTTGDVMMIAVDMTNGWVFMGKNGVWYNGSTAGNVNFSSGDGKVNNTNWATATPIYPTVQTQNIGDKLSTNFGKQDFEYEPPAGFEAMDTGGPPAQDLMVPSISAPFLLGSPEVQNLRQVIAPESLAFEATVGTPTVGYIAYHEGIEAAPALGEPAVRYRMTVMGIDSTMLLGTPTVVTAVWHLEPEGINGADGIGLGAHALSLNIKPLGIFENGALGDPAVRQIAQVSGILNEPVLGDPTLLRGVWNILAGGIINESYLGNVEANYFIRIPSIINESDLGDHLVSPVYDDAGVYPLGIVNVARFGTAKINQRLYAQGLLADTTQFGSPALKGQNALNPEGIALSPEFGTAQVNQRLHVVGIQNVSEHGIGKLVHLIQMNGEGLFTNTMLGMPSAFAGAWTVQPAGIINEIRLGNPRLDYATNEAQSYVKVAGQWVAVEKTMVKHQGEWHELLSILEKVDGSWQRIY